MKIHPSLPDPDAAPAASAVPGASSSGRNANDAKDAGEAPVWRQVDGAPVSCLEKIKVLNENYAELRQMAQDAFEDALLMGCSEAQMRNALRELVDALQNPYPVARPDPAAKP
jgi:hypothetical protein